jgi:hypothetical protein
MKKIDLTPYQAGDEVKETQKKCKDCDTEIVKICKEWNMQKSLGSYKEVGTSVSHYRMISQGVFECIKSGKQFGKGATGIEGKVAELEKRIAKLEGGNTDF